MGFFSDLFGEEKMWPDDWYRKAFFLKVGGRYSDPKKALEYLDNAIILKPDFYNAYIARAEVCIEFGRYESAIEDYNTAIRLEPNKSYAYVDRGLAYAKIGQQERAIEDYNTAIRVEPYKEYAYSVRVRIPFDVAT